MGVKYLFSYIRYTYPEAFISETPVLNHIFIDGNALLYPIADALRDTSITGEGVASVLLETAQEYASLFGCKCHIYMDGPAHMAKIKQQRARRFMYETPIISGTSMWTPALFSPGTTMMNDIHLYIEANRGKYPGIGEYSSYLDSGEGEHKIIARIKDISSTVQIVQRVGIVGKDADLILLGMSLTPEEGYETEPIIIRHDDQLVPNGYTIRDPVFFIDCRALRNAIMSKMKGSVWNLIVATFFVGNDFLPPIPGVDSIRDMFPIIRSISPELVKNGSIDWNGVLQFIDELLRRTSTSPDWVQMPVARVSVKEPTENEISTSLSDLASKIEHNATWTISSSSGSVTVETHGKYPSIGKVYNASVGMSRGVPRIDISVRENVPIPRAQYDVLYYLNMSPFPQNLKALTSSWMSTIEWVYRYYKDGLSAASVSWQYPTHYAPTLYTLKNHIDLSNLDKIRNKAIAPSTPLTPVQALCAILPVWLHTLLPPGYAQKLKKYAEYYPLSFQLQRPSNEPIIPVIPYSVVSSL